MRVCDDPVDGPGGYPFPSVFLNTQFYGLFPRHTLCEIGHEPAAHLSS